MLLGTVLDALHLGNASEVPALMLLGWWWGRLGRRGPPIERSFNLGLLALLGTALLGGTLMVQLQWQGAMPALPVAIQILVAQSLITGLLAPVLCSLQLLRWRQVASLRG